VIACQAENNVPTVGEKEAAMGRTMAWIRVERYWEGEWPDVRLKYVPVFCQQCDAAPCEPVCPTYATYQTPEGLNAQVYNRCVGTRYCANACPYSVRVFNWYDPAWETPLDLQLNPDVSVRSSGIMEKCTFCIQRIKAAKRKVDAEGRELKDGEVSPACAQSCPPKALVFGDLADPKSEVSRLARADRGHKLLGELGTQPRVTYLKGDHWHGDENA
jgi:molybdopterin-containing oxidoreductase family iron-sulfur binding subunit